MGKARTDSVLNKADTINRTDSILQNKIATQPTAPTPKKPSSTSPQPQAKKPELFNSGFIDFQNSG